MKPSKEKIVEYLKNKYPVYLRWRQITKWARIDLTDADLTDANLTDADLTGADLTDADLTGANLKYADLTYANLKYADLTDVDLTYADLTYANLKYADLKYADLTGADLTDANLTYANLKYANLKYADLTHADLTGANLKYADLTYANLTRANLTDIRYNECTSFLALQCPEEGAFVGWKKCNNNVIVKLLIPEHAKRLSATSRKCRCSEAVVLDVIGAEYGISQHDSGFHYHKGETVKVENFDDDRWKDCSLGIHFFITRREAELYP